MNATHTDITETRLETDGVCATLAKVTRNERWAAPGRRIGTLAHELRNRASSSKRSLGIVALAVLALTAAALQGCVAAVGAGAAAGASSYNDRRTSGTMVDDELIEFNVLEAIGGEPDLQAVVHVNAVSINGAVLLVGEVPEPAIRERVEQLARAVPNVRAIYNELNVAAQSTMLARSNDTILTGKVKSALIRSNFTQASRVKVVTDASTVYLMGLVTHEEADAATEVARHVGGVKRVVKIFEYTD